MYQLEFVEKMLDPELRESGASSELSESGASSEHSESGASSELSESGASLELSESGASSELSESGASSELSESESPGSYESDSGADYDYSQWNSIREPLSHVIDIGTEESHGFPSPSYVGGRIFGQIRDLIGPLDIQSLSRSYSHKFRFYDRWSDKQYGSIESDELADVVIFELAEFMIRDILYYFSWCFDGVCQQIGEDYADFVELVHVAKDRQVKVPPGFVCVLKGYGEIRELMDAGLPLIPFLGELGDEGYYLPERGWPKCFSYEKDQDVLYWVRRNNSTVFEAKENSWFLWISQTAFVTSEQVMCGALGCQLLRYPAFRKPIQCFEESQEARLESLKASMSEKFEEVFGILEGLEEYVLPQVFLENRSTCMFKHKYFNRLLPALCPCEHYSISPLATLTREDQLFRVSWVPVSDCAQINDTFSAITDCFLNTPMFPGSEIVLDNIMELPRSETLVSSSLEVSEVKNQILVFLEYSGYLIALDRVPPMLEDDGQESPSPMVENGSEESPI